MNTDTAINNKYSNDFLSPVDNSKKSWSAYDYISCWFGMNICIPAYQVASSSIALGLSWWLSIILVLIGNLIILFPVLLNSKAGAKYGIPFPVHARAAFGLRGAQFPVILRAIIGTIWTGILTWIGAESLQIILENCIPSWKDFRCGTAISFTLFFLINFGIALSGIKSMKILENIGSPILCCICATLLIWACKSTINSGYSIVEPLRIINGNQDNVKLSTIFTCLAANVAYYSTWALNISDLSRYAKNEKTQYYGHIIGLPLSMCLIAFIGVYVTGASEIIYGEKIWDPNDIIVLFDNKFVVILAALGIIIATLTTNITTNILPPASAFTNVIPKKIDFKKGVIITGILSVIVQPWRLVNDPSGYIYDWLGTCGILTGPIAGIMICDYYLFKNKILDVYSLYSPKNSAFWYKKGVNIIAILTWVISVLIILAVRVVPSLSVISANGWILGFIIGFTVYYLLKLYSIKGANNG